MTQISLFKQSPVAWKPQSYQKKAVKFLLEHACAALFLDPGLGKTSITLAAIKMLKARKLVNKVLIIAPMRVCYATWPGELDKWKDFAGLKVEVLHGPGKDAALKREADIYVINPEGLEWLTQAKKTKTENSKKASYDVDLRRWKALGFDTLVIDELTKFKNTSSSRFKIMKKIHGLFGRRWGLTGSPAANGLLDLFGQCYILDEGRSLGPYVTKYRTEYFKEVGPFTWIPKDGAPELIYERLSPLALRMSSEDYLDMPALIINNIRLDMPASAMDIYIKMEDDLIASIEANVIVASNAAVASGKCRQIANGALYLDREVVEMGLAISKGKREWADIHTEKLDALEDLVDELQGSPLLVAYDFGHDQARLRARFPGAEFAADCNVKDYRALEARWNNGEIHLLFGHPASLGHGLNLQKCGHHVAWYAMNWDKELYDQFIARVWRQGNDSKKVFVHHFIMRDTIDEAIYGALKSKHKGQKALFDGLKELAKTRRQKRR